MKQRADLTDAASPAEVVARLRDWAKGRAPTAWITGRGWTPDMFPGKANSLDALCKRLEVDNSHRELHGALLDAGLLSEVYIRMTRGQGSLVGDDGANVVYRISTAK